MPTADPKECGMILAKLEAFEMRLTALEKKTDQHCRLNTEAVERIDAKLDEVLLQRAEERGQFNGATWMLAKIGAIVVLGFGFIGWLISQGLLPLKRLFT